MTSTFTRRGRPNDPKPVDSKVVTLVGCPDCNGRGWFLINPFATGGSNGCGGVGNMCQCLTCLDAHEFYLQHQRLPDELLEAMDSTASGVGELVKRAIAAAKLNATSQSPFHP